MKKSLIKFSVWFLAAGLFWYGLALIGGTLAYFSDMETAGGNAVRAGSLDFSLRSGQSNFVPPEIAGDMQPGDSVTRDIYIKKDGSLPFRYMAVSEASGQCDEEFYNLLQVQVWYNYYTDTPQEPDYHEYRVMTLKYSGLLKDFQMNLGGSDDDLMIPSEHEYYDNVFYGSDEHWFYFQITYPAEAEKLTGQSCQFDFVFNGWQVDLHPAGGFTDNERIGSSLVDAIDSEPALETMTSENDPEPESAQTDEDEIGEGEDDQSEDGQTEAADEEEPPVDEPAGDEPAVEEPQQGLTDENNGEGNYDEETNAN